MEEIDEGGRKRIRSKGLRRREVREDPEEIVEDGQDPVEEGLRWEDGKDSDDLLGEDRDQE